jgi:hypothetical protein
MAGSLKKKRSLLGFKTKILYGFLIYPLRTYFVICSSIFLIQIVNNKKKLIIPTLRGGQHTTDCKTSNFAVLSCLISKGTQNMAYTCCHKYENNAILSGWSILFAVMEASSN